MADALKTRFLYLLPRYDVNSPEHFYHLFGFLRKLGERIPMEILVERLSGSASVDLAMRPLRIRIPAFRMVEELLRFLTARLRGVKDFYVHYSYTGAVAASIVTRLLGGRVFYWNCGMYADMGPLPGASWRQKAVFRWNCFCLETSVRSCHFLVTGTPRMAAYYAEHARIPLAKILVLPNFVDIDRFQALAKEEARRILGLDPARKIVLYLHKVAPRRGAEYLPELARSLLGSVGPVTMLVVGAGPYLPELRRRVESQGLGENFDFRQWIPNRDVPAFYRAADLYVMPSDVEGFPRVLLEAMAAGCPFVTFDVGGVRDVISPLQEECVVESRDVRSFAERCIRALKDRALLEAWRRAGEKQVGLFSEERVLEAFVRMIGGESLDWRAFLAPEDGQ